MGAIAAYAPFGGIVRASQGVLAQGEFYTVSVPSLIRWLLQQAGVAHGRWLVMGSLGFLFLVTYAWSLRRTARDWPSLATLGCVAFFLFLALVWPQFHPWYLVWPLALVPFVQEPTLAFRLVFFSALAVLSFSFGHAWPWQQAAWGGEPQALAALVVFLPPLLLPRAWVKRIVDNLSQLTLHPA
jgi:hypothetical protein